jgi:entericidin B
MTISSMPKAMPPPRARRITMRIIIATATPMAIGTMPTERHLLFMHRRSLLESACSCRSSFDGKVSGAQRCAGNGNRSEDIMMRLIVLFMIAGTALLAGCNTIAGAGEDVSKGGQAIHNTAEDAK